MYEFHTIFGQNLFYQMDHLEDAVPEKISILFISKAASGNGKHFYKADTELFRAIRNAFEEQFGMFENNDSFFLFFKSCGCYLDHLCLHQLNKENKLNLHTEKKLCINFLADRIKTYQPKMIIIMMKEIIPEVEEAIRISSITSIQKIKAASFPSMSERNRLACISSVKSALHEAVCGGII